MARYTSAPASAVLGAVITPPTVNSVVTSPLYVITVMVYLPGASVCRYTAFR